MFVRAHFLLGIENTVVPEAIAGGHAYQSFGASFSNMVF